MASKLQLAPPPTAAMGEHAPPRSGPSRPSSSCHPLHTAHVTTTARSKPGSPPAPDGPSDRVTAALATRLSHPLLTSATAASSGLLLALAYPPFEFTGLVWVALWPLLAALWLTPVRNRRNGRPASPAWRGFRLGWIAGAVFFAINLNWIQHVHPVGVPFLAAYLGLYFAIWGAFAGSILRLPRLARDLAPRWWQPSLLSLRTALVLAGLWAGLEWLRGLVMTGFGWNGLAVALHEQLPMLQIAEFVGVGGVSALVLFCSLIAFTVSCRLLAELGRRRVQPHIDFGLTIMLVLAVFFFGLGRMRDHAAPRDDGVDLRLLLVQPNIHQDLKWEAEYAPEIYFTLEQLTAAYLETFPFDLVLWPESAVPYEFHTPGHRDFFNDLLAPQPVGLLLGANYADPQLEAFFNSVILMEGEFEQHQVYRKIHLVPFGEFLPLRHVLPWPKVLSEQLLRYDFDRGTSTEPLRLASPDIDLLPLVCFEDTVGRLVRRFVGQGRPQLLVNVTNDGWFYESSAARQHFANARFRCIELRRPMARSANTGVSAVIDEVGGLHPADQRGAPARVVKDPDTGSTFITGALPVDLRLDPNPPLTLYARHGDWFSVLMMAPALLWAAAAGWRSRRARRQATDATAAP